jgi:hypothetical protein
MNTTTVRYNSWDDKSEELTIRDAANEAAVQAGIKLEMPRLGSFADLRKELLDLAYMTVISGHGGPSNSGGSEADMDPWHLSGKKDLPWVTVPDLLRKGDKIGARIVFVAACHGRLSAWQRHLMPGALLIVTTHRVTYPAVKWMLTHFLPLVPDLEAARAAAFCIKEAWDGAREGATASARTLARDEFAYGFATAATCGALHGEEGNAA